MRKRVLSVALLLSSVVGLNAQSLSDVFEPRVVAVPPSDAYVGLSMTEDGELRHYNYSEQRVDGSPYYISSRDSGFTWSRVNLPFDIPYADIRSPRSGEYIRAIHSTNRTFVVRTVGGIDGGRTITMIDSTLSIMLKPPVFADGGNRVLIGAHHTDRKGCFTYVSTDDGLSWQKSNIVNTPFHTSGGFHKGVRWNHGAVEPTVIEKLDGTLWMIMRTSLDRHYESFSVDGGMTWSEPTESQFYGTITMPTLHRMADGRLLFFWCNTTPLPEMESATGVWDDVFTNRNVAHVAISEDDGKNWIGMRELYIDPLRNSEVFGESAGIDKSVHQVQVVEVAPGKILVSVGQHELHRRMLLFDVEWLYETQRESHFEDSLSQWSAFRYFKGIVGHCGYNRQEMPLIEAHPDKEGENVLRIGYQADSRFVEDNYGAVWNFPAAHSGVVELSVRIPEGAQPIDLVLNDRWFNPTDTVAKYENQYCVELSRGALGIRDNGWHRVRLEWGSDGRATLYNGRRRLQRISINDSSENGISYLHLLGGVTPDSVGVMVEWVRKY